MVKANNIIKTKMKKNMTDFCKDKFNKNFIFYIFSISKKKANKMVRLLGFEPRTSWSVAKRSIQLSYRRIFLKNNHVLIDR